jgi:acetyl esterase/lipase
MLTSREGNPEPPEARSEGFGRELGSLSNHTGQAMQDARKLEQQVRQLGPNFDAKINEATREIYRRSVDLTLAGEERVDVAYGEHERHKLDIYVPRTKPLGTVVYVHGGGFVGGDKNGDGVFYVNVGRWLARNGWTAVLPNYRLAPSAVWPAGTQDIQAVMQWVNAPGADFAPSGSPTVVLGQSAGAAHVASWLFDSDARRTQIAAASAVMLMSGFYEAAVPLSAGPRAYFGEDEDLYISRSALSHVAAPRFPLWLSVAELEPAGIAQHTYALARAVTLAQGWSPDFHFFRGHNHVSTVQSLGSAQTDVATEILRFLNGIELT